MFGFHSLAAYVFFFLSGLLVTESALRHNAAPARYLRIFPALLIKAVVVPVALVAADAWTGASLVDLRHYTLRW